MLYVVEAFVDYCHYHPHLTGATRARSNGGDVWHSYVFPADTMDKNDPISLKKMLKLESMWVLENDILGSGFDGVGICFGWRRESEMLY